jgi:HSP90 family molecular chaperone
LVSQFFFLFQNVLLMISLNLRRNLNNIKSDVRRVFVMNNWNELIPEYFNFLKGIVDSDDLSLTIYFEQLKQNQIIKLLDKTLSRRHLNSLILLKRKNRFQDILWAIFKDIKLDSIKTFLKSIDLFSLKNNQRLKNNLIIFNLIKIA